MRFRTLILTALLVGGFVYITANQNSFVRRSFTGTSTPLWNGPTVAKSAGLSSDETNNIDIYKASSESVVKVTSTVYQRNFFFVEQAHDLGSGFIINPEGQILTNFHVISGSSEVEVTLPDQGRYKAQVLVRDRQDDLALIKIEPKRKLKAISLGDSDHLQVGQKVLAIGNPFGFEGTLTTGVVSSLRRDIPTENNQMLEAMIQTDASINSGNSGGPLLDSQGNVIGINTAIYGPSGGSVGIGFASPINRAKSMLDGFRAGKSFGRARLGITTVFIGGDFAEALKLPRKGGLLIQRVVPRGPADSAGLRGANEEVRVGNERLGVGGDFVTEVDGKQVDEPDAVTRAIARKRPGDTMDLTVFRGGHSMNIKVKLGEAPEEP
jgi:S1-C subfamily serine protease